MSAAPTPPNPYADLTSADKKKWVCVYPAYINSRKTIVEGRRIQKAQAVDNPLSSEICDVCKSQKLNAEVEMERYFSRELVKDYLHQGRVRVQLYNQDDTPCNQAIATRKQLYLMLGELIPKLKSRATGTSTAGDNTSSNQTSALSKKKKGKKNK